jgi:hypothetical protein
MNTNQALIRDGYRCFVTKKYDQISVSQIRELRGEGHVGPQCGNGTHAVRTDIPRVH